jgi:TonB dependent receptor
MKTLKVVWVVGLAISMNSLHAQQVYLQGGTLGVGIGAALNVTKWFGIHADFNAINLSHNFTVGGNRYEDGIRLRQGGIYGDMFPWSNSGFRVTAGLRITDNEVSGNSVPTNGVYVFEGKASPAFPGEYATATVKYPTVMPYLGIGYGLQPRGKGFGLVLDLGVAYGVPRSSYTLSPALSQAAGPTMSQQIIASGLQQLRDKASPFRWYPTLQIGVSYHF